MSKRVRIQAKHIPAIYVLLLLEHLGSVPKLMPRRGWLPIPSDLPDENPLIGRNDLDWINRTQVCEAWPEIPPKVIMAKMNNLIRKDLVDGCTCGCRGDFHLTNRGKLMLAIYYAQTSQELQAP